MCFFNDSSKFKSIISFFRISLNGPSFWIHNIWVYMKGNVEIASDSIKVNLVQQLIVLSTAVHETGLFVHRLKCWPVLLDYLKMCNTWLHGMYRVNSVTTLDKQSSSWYHYTANIFWDHILWAFDGKWAPIRTC